MARVFSCPENELAGEIGFALAYILACNGDVPDLLTLRRRDLSEAIAGMLAERAGKGLSGMTITEDTGNAEVPEQATRA